jgi:oxygen-independent coproporphyrinogen-3 oxidase
MKISDYTLVEEYVGLLIKELTFYNKEELKTIYIGGGTPSMLEPGDFLKLLDALHKIFDLTFLQEFTVEANPESVSSELVQAWKSSGVNRLSLGVQSFDNGVLTRVGRLARREQILTAIEDIQSSCFKNISLDILCGIQDVITFQSDLDYALLQKPDHLSIYMLNIAENTRLMEMVRDGSFKTLREDQFEYLYYYTHEKMVNHHFNHYEISNYARPGFESIHNLNYWEGGDYIGVGISAVSSIGNRRFRNSTSIHDYREMITEGRKPVVEVENLTKKNKNYEKIMLSLRTSSGISLEELKYLTNQKKLQNLSQYIDEILSEDLVELNNGRLCLTVQGMFRSSEIITDFWNFLDK